MMNYRMMSFGLLMTIMWGMAPSTGCGQAIGQEHDGHARKQDAGDNHDEESAGHGQNKAAAHGGGVTMTKEFHFESVFTPKEIRVYAYDGSQNPMQVKHWKQGLIGGKVMVQFRDRSRKPIHIDLKRAMQMTALTKRGGGHEHGEAAEHGDSGGSSQSSGPVLWVCPMHPKENGKTKGKCSACGMNLTPQDYLFASVDLSGVGPNEAKAVFTLTNLPGRKEKQATFTQKIVLAKAAEDTHDEYGEHDEHDKP